LITPRTLVTIFFSLITIWYFGSFIFGLKAKFYFIRKNLCCRVDTMKFFSFNLNGCKLIHLNFLLNTPIFALR